MDKKLIKLAKEGDQNSIETICAAFKGLVINQANSTYLKNYETEDLIQEGNLSILKAIKMYNLENNTAFEPYVINSVKNNFFYLIRKCSRYNFEGSLNFALTDDMDIQDTLISRHDTRRIN